MQPDGSAEGIGLLNCPVQVIAKLIVVNFIVAYHVLMQNGTQSPQLTMPPEQGISVGSVEVGKCLRREGNFQLQINE